MISIFLLPLRTKKQYYFPAMLQSDEKNIYNNCMKPTEYRKYHLWMAGEIHALADTLSSRVCFLLSLKEALDGKDGFTEEERFSDDTFMLQDRFYNVYLQTLKNISSNSTILEDVLIESEIIPVNLIDDIKASLAYKEDVMNLYDSVFSPNRTGKEDEEDAEFEFILRLVILFRTMNWINDIETGIQEYGIDCYLVPETDSKEDVNVLDGIFDLDYASLKKELKDYLRPQDDDTDELLADKKSIAILLKEINKKEPKQK